MAIEFERKFLLPAKPDADRLGPGVHIRQGYLAEEDGVEVRVRITPDSALLTVKAGTGLSRTEVEVTISPTDADELWQHTERRRVDKTRHRVVLDDAQGLVAEVDVYGGDLEGLHIVEVEFGTAAGANAFVPPAWFGQELTGQRGWSNAALARRGPPK